MSPKILKAFILFIISGLLYGCHTNSDKDTLRNAEIVIEQEPDSALMLLTQITNPEGLGKEQLANYYYLKARGHFLTNQSMVSDSMLTLSELFYQKDNSQKALMCKMLNGSRMLWIGKGEQAISKLDSLEKVTDFPDTMLPELLKMRLMVSAGMYDGRRAIKDAKHLIEIDTARMNRFGYLGYVATSYFYTEQYDSALIIKDWMMALADSLGLTEAKGQIMLDRAMLLTEAGQGQEAIETLNKMIPHVKEPENLAYLHTCNAHAFYNLGKMTEAKRELKIVDSLIEETDRRLFPLENYKSFIGTLVEAQTTGRVKLPRLTELARMSNIQSENFNRLVESQVVAEADAIAYHEKALLYQLESQRKTFLILMVIAFALLLAGASAWIISMRRRRMAEQDEKIETLTQLLARDKADADFVRHTMLNQLGILKMVASNPTAGNKELLRKIIEEDEALINWNDIYATIDHSFDNFYTKILKTYDLNEREVQLLCLLRSGFSSKEIMIITGQSAQTVYQRRSTIRKKLDIPEKEDIVSYLIEHL